MTMGFGNKLFFDGGFVVTGVMVGEKLCFVRVILETENVLIKMGWEVDI